MVFGGKFRLRRCNSKASYLPRQSRDKLNSTDPDHGSYKLTLTSNEDSISQNTTTAYHDDILSTKCNNLPDVLPVGAKVQSSSPSSSSNSSPRYGSNNNINNSTPPHTAPPIISNYPMKSLFHFQNSINNNSNTNNSPRSNASPTANSPPAYNSPHRLSPFISSEQISPKFMSQSTIDLKKTHVIESTEITPLSKMLSPAQSENNISSHEKPPLSPFSARREKQRTEIVRKLSLEEKDSGEGRIVRAELVNTILSSSPTRSEEKIMIRKDSFRENIEKITQLQSKLMTAHLVDNGGEKKLLGYTGRTVELKAHQQVFETETSKSHESLSTKSSSSTKVLFNPSEPPTSPPPPTPTSPPPNNIEPLSQMDTEIDGLKLMQRTEIILRLNAPTMEAASQTDETHELEISRVRLIDSRDDVSKSSERLATSALEPRKRLPEEIDCDILSKELADCLPITDKLCQVLAPKIYKVASDYVGGLYNPHVSVKLSKKDISTSTLNDKSVGCELIKAPNVELHGTASSTAERLDREVRNVVLTNGSDSCDLNKKKEELINRLTKAVEVLISEQTSVSEKSATNELLGSDLAAKIAEKVRPIEASKFRAYIDDVGHITMLLLSLSGRLAKLENVLHSGSENHPEKKIFEVKRDRLLEQLEEAKRLKEDIDRRGTIVSKMLEKHLTTEEYVDYEYFINMKAKLIVDSREITERIKLNEEQLTALKSTLVQADC